MRESPSAGCALHVWPADAAQVLAELRSGTGVTVIGRALPPTASCTEARASIRKALKQTLAAFFGQPAAAVTLTSRPGQAIQVQVQMRMQAPGTAPVFVSISHMPGLSVAAISSSGAVGVDVMVVDAPLPPGWEWVALDYLGPQAAAALHRTAPAERATAFAQAWVSGEARLKCLGLGLTEWTPSLAMRLTACDVHWLALPPGICGAVARG